MRIKIEPITGFFGEVATHLSSDNNRLVDGRVITTLAYWSDAGKKLAEKDVELDASTFDTWRKSNATKSDAEFATAQLAKVGAVAKVEPVVEPPEVIPETPEEEATRLKEEAAQAEAQRLADIATIEDQIARMQAQLDTLKTAKP